VTPLSGKTGSTVTDDSFPIGGPTENVVVAAIPGSPSTRHLISSGRPVLTDEEAPIVGRRRRAG
jgi:hypothetical protein